MKNVLSFLLAFMLLISLNSCNVYRKVYYDYDTNVDFENYVSYAWLPDIDEPDNNQFDNEIIRSNTKNYFGHCMNQQMYKIDTLSPDLLLQVEWITKSKELVINNIYSSAFYYDPNYYSDPFPYNYYSWSNYNWDRGFVDFSKTETIDYKYSAVILNVIDRNENRLIWRGIAEGDIFDPSKIKGDLHPAIHKMMSKFPNKTTDN